MTDPSSQSGARRRAIVLVPGFRQEERFKRRDILVKQLLAAPGTALIETSGPAGMSERGKGLATEALRGGTPGTELKIDLFEAYWADQIEDEPVKAPLQRMVWGLQLVVYWCLSWRTWQALRISRFMTFGMVSGGLLLVLWYISVALLAAEAISKTGAETADFQGLPLFDQALQLVHEFASAVGNWQLWAVVAVLLPLFQVDEVVALARFTMDYFLNKTNDTGLGLRHRIRLRVKDTLDAVYGADYDEVYIVAHSFGTVIAVDILAKWPHTADMARTTLVTWGSPVAVLLYRAPGLKQKLDQLVSRDDLAGWYDFYSGTDWLCTAMPGLERFKGEKRHFKVRFDAGSWRVMTGQTHMDYYTNGEVLGPLVAPGFA